MTDSTLESRYRKAVNFDEDYLNILAEEDNFILYLEGDKNELERAIDISTSPDLELELANVITLLAEQVKRVEYLSNPTSITDKWDTLWTSVIENVPLEKVEHLVSLIELTKDIDISKANNQFNETWDTIIKFNTGGLKYDA